MNDVLCRVRCSLCRVGVVGTLALAAAAYGCAAGDSSETGFVPPDTPMDGAVDGVAGSGGDAAGDVIKDQSNDVVDQDVVEPDQQSDTSVEDVSADGEPDGPDGDLDGAGDVADSEPDSCANQPEICDGLDNNCNGQKDENDPGGDETCQVPNKLGVCADGTTHCQNAQVKCVQNTPASAEICDGLDNNCDGVDDNNTTDSGGTCNTGKQGICAAGTEKCVGGTIQCEQNLQAGSETCNGLDDDCNGTPDDGFPGVGDPCTVPNQPANTPCAQGKTNCLGGQNGCTQTVFPSSELCDGIDNDCNGTIDDPTVVDNKVCPTGLPGECASGKTQCSGGVSQCIANVSPGAVPESCNAKDDDCNGTVDDILNVKLECATKFSNAQNVMDWACTVGTCQVVACAGAYSDCDSAPANGCEVNTLNDLVHCGQCNKMCNSSHGTPSCNFGTCQIACNLGWGNCDGNAANGCEQSTTNDVNHCGGCGQQCDDSTGTPACVASACTVACNAGLGNCDNNITNGCETVLTTDPLHCGSCTKICSTNGGVATCAAGLCGITCNPTTANCDNDVTNGCEVNLLTSATHCGGCTNVCSTNHGTASCSGGLCAISCSTGYGNCNNDLVDGCETTLATSATNCGGCGNVCDTTNGTASCVAGGCQIACNNGWGNCDGNVTNGCETNLKTDAAHCNSCTTPCSTSHATPSCTNGVCAVVSCETGWGNCDNSAANGCEVDHKTDELNCGSCNTQCSASGGTPNCNNGTCGIACTVPYGDCDSNPGNGCETDTSNNVLHCGSCAACSTNHASPTCTNSQCILSCVAPWQNCDGFVSNGCELNLFDPLHCGTCTKVCNSTNGTPGCAAGSCTIACDAGFGNCDGNADNGCETNLKNDLNNCNACGNVCNLPNAVSLCSNSACVISSCASGFQNCDGNTANGCEANLNTNALNCGGCGNVCDGTNGVPGCNGGACQITCNTGWGNCDGSVANGCETNTTTNVNNCSGCGVVCSTTQPHVTSRVCTNSQCVVETCESSYHDQNGQFTGGCECREEQPSVPDTCTNAVNLGTVAIDGTLSTVVGNLSPTTTDSDWYRVTFTANTCGFSPKVVVGDDPQARIRVYTGCSGATPTGSQVCSDAGNSTVANLKVWEVVLSGTCDDSWYPNAAYTMHSQPMAGTFATIPLTVWIQVYSAADTVSCAPYTLTISN